MAENPRPLSRRAFIERALRGMTALALGPSLLHASTLTRVRATCEIGPLLPPDANGVRLPEGFTSRIVATSLRKVRDGLNDFGYRWHMFPDGGATFATPDGGWIYVSNSETLPALGAGVGALRFDGNADIVDAYRILGDTTTNCAGGATPWQTWLSCEEVPYGRVWECDPFGIEPAIVRDALGWFEHEAAVVDSVNNVLYMTEDDPDGRLYRFIPDQIRHDGIPDLTAGTLQVAIVDPTTMGVSWADVPQPNPDPANGDQPTRFQVSESTAFDGGEGCWYHQGIVYFTTKGDNRVWALDTATQMIAIIYDDDTSPNPILTGVDNVTVSAQGQVLVAEDGGDMQIVVINPDLSVAPLLQVVGQDDSEITGPAFNPAGDRLYFSSQRGNPRGGRFGFGITFEVTGPFAERFGC